MLMMNMMIVTDQLHVVTNGCKTVVNTIMLYELKKSDGKGIQSKEKCKTVSHIEKTCKA